MLADILKDLFRQPWFRYGAFRERLSAPVYAGIMSGAMNQVVPEMVIESRAVVGYVRGSSVLKAGDIITRIREAGEGAWQDTETWKELVDFLLDKKVSIAVVSISRDGDMVETTVVFKE